MRLAETIIKKKEAEFLPMAFQLFLSFRLIPKKSATRWFKKTVTNLLSQLTFWDYFIEKRVS
jgi:hypothetical protein